MARLPGKSRGCLKCRQRRVKCDEKLPNCGQCARLLIRCPGAITDTFYVICSVSQRNAATLGRNKNPSQSYDSSLPIPPKLHRHAAGSLGQSRITVTFQKDQHSSPSHQDKPINYDTFVGIHDSVNANAFSALIDFELPSGYQPSRVELFNQLYFSHFFDTYGQSVETLHACSWLSHLPRLMASVFKSRAMKYSCRATCMAFYGIITGDVSVKHEARSVYTAALRSQRLEVYGISSASTLTTPSQEAICSAVLMAYFEMITNKTSPAWEQHMAAAARMFEMRGPAQCHERFNYQVFRTVRLGMVCLSIMRRRHISALQPWVMNVDPEFPKTPLDVLLDVLLSLSSCIEARVCCRNVPTNSDTESEQQTILEKLHIISYDLDLYASSIFKNPTVNTNPSAVSEGADDDLLPECMKAIYNATRLILSHLLKERCEWSERAKHKTNMLSYSAHVLSAVKSINHRTQGFGSKMFISVFFALEVVKNWGCSPADTARADRYLGNDLIPSVDPSLGLSRNGFDAGR